MKRIVSLFALVAVITSLFIFTSSTTASAHPSYVRGNCWGATCFNQDPTQMHCLTNVVFHPYKKAEYYNGVVVGYMTSVYSYNCNSNWDEAELTSYATSRGWAVQTFINTVDSQGNADEVVCYPDDSVDCITAYQGATGWPTVSNMVDGSGTTYSEFIVYNGGTRIVDDKTIQQ